MEEYYQLNIKEIGLEDMNWTNVPEETVQWRALVNTVMKFWVL
jgi:hypothetical protein